MFIRAYMLWVSKLFMVYHVETVLSFARGQAGGERPMRHLRVSGCHCLSDEANQPAGSHVQLSTSLFLHVSLLSPPLPSIPLMRKCAGRPAAAVRRGLRL